ncbi:hypothetical protein F5888DRAFT_456160 [Russula emetica]|nr:hypothetical protein F5888DRAFT_456160 [Russula emetica]
MSSSSSNMTSSFSLFPTSTAAPCAFGLFGQDPRESHARYEDLAALMSTSSSSSFPHHHLLLLPQTNKEKEHRRLQRQFQFTHRELEEIFRRLIDMERRKKKKKKPNPPRLLPSYNPVIIHPNNCHRHRHHNSIIHHPPCLGRCGYHIIPPSHSHTLPLECPPCITASFHSQRHTAPPKLPLEEPIVPTHRAGCSLCRDNQYAPLVFQPDFH